nr:hypothetical protein [Tanacetum cinerariifolium]
MEGYKIYVHKGVDKKMKDADTVEFRNDEGEMNMAEDAGIEKIAEEKIDDTSAGNAMATDLQTKETILVPLSLMDVLIQHDTPQLQSPSALKSQVPQVVNDFFESRLGNILQKEVQKNTADMMKQYNMKLTPDITPGVLGLLYNEHIEGTKEGLGQVHY